VIVSVIFIAAAIDVPVATAANGVLAYQTPDGKHRLGRSTAAAATATVIAAVVGIASTAGTGPRAQIHDYGGAMVTGLRSNHRVDGADGVDPDGADDIYGGHDTDTNNARDCIQKLFLIFLFVFNILKVSRDANCKEINTSFSLRHFQPAETKMIDENFFLN
jgi:hypothetical protein